MEFMDYFLFFLLILALAIGYLIKRNAYKLKYNGKEADTFIVAGIRMTCAHCGHSTFNLGKSQLNTAASTFFKFDWANPEITFLSCDKCGFIHWFNKPPNELKEWIKN